MLTDRAWLEPVNLKPVNDRVVAVFRRGGRFGQAVGVSLHGDRDTEIAKRGSRNGRAGARSLQWGARAC